MARYTQMWWIKTVLTTKRTKKSPILSPATIKWFFFILFSNQFKAQLNNCSSLTNGRIQASSWIFFHLDMWLIESVKAFDSYRPPFFCVFNLGNSVSSSNFIIRCTTDKSNHNYINQCRLCVCECFCVCIAQIRLISNRTLDNVYQTPFVIGENIYSTYNKCWLQ